MIPSHCRISGLVREEEKRGKYDIYRTNTSSKENRNK